LIFEIEPHGFFRREGIDLFCKKTISLKEALCGFSVEVLHLNGKTLRMTNQTQNNVVKPGYRREVPGFGMIRGDQTGKMIMEFDVSFPESITPEQRLALSEIF
jgi:DnaJ family protein A protein 2